MSEQRQPLPKVFSVGDWLIDGNALTASRRGESRPLEPKALQVLRYLCERHGELVTIDELMDSQWAGTVVTPNAVSRVIAQLRKVLDDDARNPSYIETVARTGYRCIAPTSEAPAKTARRLPAAAIAAGIAALLAGLVYLWPGEPAEPSVAVLPFQNMTGNVEWDYIADGVAEEIINTLSRVTELRVRPQIQSFGYRGTSKELAEIARELDVTYLVSGSVRMSGQNLRLAAQLVDPVNGENVRSLTEEYGVLELFEGQDAVSLAVADALIKVAGLPDLEPEPARAKPDPDAYDLYLRGRHVWHRRGSEPLQPAIDYFREAVQIDPEFARGWAALAMAYLTYPSYSPRGYATWYDAEPAAEKALSLDPGIAEAYSVLGTFAQTRFEWSKAESLFLESIRRDGQSATAHYWYAEFLETVGRHAEGVGHLQRALQLDPTSRPPQLMHGITHMNFRDYPRAADLLLELWLSGHTSQLSWTANFITAVYGGDAGYADEWIGAGPADDDYRALLRRFVDAKLRGQQDTALIEDIANFYWRRPDYPLGTWMLGHLGGYERTFALVNTRLDNGRQLELRGFWAPEIGTREQPEFVELLQRVGLIEYWDAAGWGSVCVQSDQGVDCSGQHMTPALLESLLSSDTLP